MFNISKGMVAAAALVALAVTTIGDLSWSSEKSPAAAFALQETASNDAVVQNAALRARAAALLLTLVKRQRHHHDASASESAAPTCRDQTWPYYSDDCLVWEGEAGNRTTARIVKIERVAATMIAR